MHWRPSTPRSASAGLTLVELLVAAVIAILLLGLAFNLVISNRRVYRLDQARTAVNQNLRAALDLIGADVRQAGERLPADFPALEVEDGGTADVLVLRKNRLDTVLPVCDDIAGDQNVIFVNRQGSAPHPNPACYRLDDDGNGWDDRHEAWIAYRCAQDGVPGCQGNADEVTRAYLYDPVTGFGEFFTYVGDDLSRSHLHKRATERWQHAYDADHRPRLYLIEEHRYRLQGDVLELIENGGTPKKLVDRLLRFEAWVELDDGSTRTSFGPRDGWTRLAAVFVELEGREAYDQGRTVDRELQGRYLPRNVLSH